MMIVKMMMIVKTMTMVMMMMAIVKMVMIVRRMMIMMIVRMARASSLKLHALDHCRGYEILNFFRVFTW